MIERIKFTNWLCHKDLDLLLDPITIFVGDNDSGKSACLRGFKWALLNQWDGEADKHISWGEEFSQIEVWLNGQDLIRKKGKGVNTYILNGEVLLAGRSLPPAVSAACPMSDRNFQGQQDPAFWLMLRGTEAATELNELFSLEEIDQVTSNIQQRLRTARTAVNASEEALREAQKRYQELLWVKEAADLQSHVKQCMSRIESLDQKIQKIKNWLRHSLNRKNKLYRLARLRSLMSLTSEIFNEMKKDEVTVRSLVEYAKIKKRLKTLQATEKQLKLLTDLRLSFDCQQKVLQTYTKYTHQREVLCKLQTRLRELQNQLQSLKLCPVCKRPM